MGDDQGTVRDIVSASGTAVLDHIDYDSFGNVRGETNGAAKHLFGYTGRPLDGETGLQNNHHRWYDANTGRWISKDPIGFIAGDANLSRYAANGPVNATDPSGLFVRGDSPNGADWPVETGPTTDTGDHPIPRRGDDPPAPRSPHGGGRDFPPGYPDGRRIPRAPTGETIPNGTVRQTPSPYPPGVYWQNRFLQVTGNGPLGICPISHSFIFTVDDNGFVTTYSWGNGFDDRTAHWYRNEGVDVVVVYDGLPGGIFTGASRVGDADLVQAIEEAFEELSRSGSASDHSWGIPATCKGEAQRLLRRAKGIPDIIEDDYWIQF